MNSIKLVLVLVVAFSFVAACTKEKEVITLSKNTGANAMPANEPTPGPPATPFADVSTTGRDLYTVNCMICHRDSGTGGKTSFEGKTITPDDLTTDKFRKMTDEKLIGYVTDGVEDEGMPAFGGKLTPEQIKAVVKHVRTLQQ